MAEPRIWMELLTYGLGIALSPIHIFLLLLLLLVPFLAVLIGRERVLPLLQRGKTALLRRGELVVGSLSFGLGSYLSWQGISGLMIN